MDIRARCSGVDVRERTYEHPLGIAADRLRRVARLGGDGRGPGHPRTDRAVGPAIPAALTAAAGKAEIGVSTRRWVLLAPSCRATLALLSLTAAAAIVLLGLWAILDR